MSHHFIPFQATNFVEILMIKVRLYFSRCVEVLMLLVLEQGGALLYVSPDE